MSSAHEYQITVFSPEGKLHQIEYAFKAIRGCGVTSVGVRGRDCVVLCTEKKVGDRMMDPASVTALHRLTAGVGCLATGREADGRAWVARLRQEAFEHQQQNGEQVTADVLTSRAADIAQLYTQRASMRAYAVELMIAGVDREKGPLLLKLDPAGHFAGYHGVASGAKEQEAASALEKAFKERGGFAGLEEADVVRVAIESLQETIGQEFKASDVEIGIVRSGSPFLKLTENEIDAHLRVIQKFE